MQVSERSSLPRFTCRNSKAHLQRWPQEVLAWKPVRFYFYCNNCAVTPTSTSSASCSVSTDVVLLSLLNTTAMAEKRKAEYDQYWRLNSCAQISRSEREQIRALVLTKGYPVTTSTTKPTLLRYADRIELEQVCYHSCSDDELQRFRRDRGLGFRTTEGSWSRKACIERLETADRELKFDRFTILPPELRILVYECYMADFRKPLRCPIQPPLSRASRLLRLEALPGFLSVGDLLGRSATLQQYRLLREQACDRDRCHGFPPDHE